MEKHCPRCNITKPITEFYFNRARYDRLTVYCSTCHRELGKIQKAKNPNYIRHYHKRLHWDQKLALFEILGAKSCVYCGCAIWQALQIEHKNGNGYLDKLRFKALHSFFRYYIAHPHEAQENLQITCANCNWIKRWKDGHNVKHAPTIRTP